MTEDLQSTPRLSRVLVEIFGGNAHMELSNCLILHKSCIRIYYLFRTTRWVGQFVCMCLLYENLLAKSQQNSLTGWVHILGHRWVWLADNSTTFRRKLDLGQRCGVEWRIESMNVTRYTEVYIFNLEACFCYSRWFVSILNFGLDYYGVVNDIRLSQCVFSLWKYIRSFPELLPTHRRANRPSCITCVSNLRISRGTVWTALIYCDFFVPCSVIVIICSRRRDLCE